MASPPWADEVAPTQGQRVVAAHLKECWQFAEFQATYPKSWRKRWEQYCREGVPLMVVSYTPGWWPRVKGVG